MNTLLSTYEHAGSGIAEIDCEGRLIRINSRLCELMDSPTEALLGCSIFDHTVAEDAGADRETYERQVAGDMERFTVEKRIRRRNGTLFWASVTSSSVRDENGDFLYAVRVFDDIGECKRTEAALASRAREQAALRQFSDQLQRAAVLADVYECALDAMQQALLCGKGSILMIDRLGVMRFVASRGLSASYQRAATSHSPWDNDQENPQPVCIDDVDQAGLPGPLRTALSRDNLRALAFIPLVNNGRLLGKFMAYYEEPHAFSETEIGGALTLANQLRPRDPRRADTGGRHIPPYC